MNEYRALALAFIAAAVLFLAEGIMGASPVAMAILAASAIVLGVIAVSAWHVGSRR
ncbi:MAG: hypothetical protein JWM19_914 [Actinomycetia bacterium]|nr:hypothetical protein [Actinomycetes bacterium]